MNRKLDLYSKPDCVHCVTAKQILSTNLIAFNEFIIGSDISLDEFKAANPTIKTVPAFFVDDVYIGGSSVLSDVIKMMETSDEEQ